jgi:hypothetical protein
MRTPVNDPGRTEGDGLEVRERDLRLGQHFVDERKEALRVRLSRKLLALDPAAAMRARDGEPLRRGVEREQFHGAILPDGGMPPVVGRR